MSLSVPYNFQELLAANKIADLIHNIQPHIGEKIE